MRENQTTHGRPSRICVIVGFGLGLVGSLLLGLVLGTAYGFGLLLHLVLAGIAGYLLAMKCTEDDDELFGIVGLLQRQRRDRLTGVADKVVETAKEGAERVADAARRLPGRAAGAAGGLGGTWAAGSRDEPPAEAESQRKATSAADDTSDREAPAMAPERSSADAPAGPPFGTSAIASADARRLAETETPALGAERAETQPDGEQSEGSPPPLLDAPRGDPDDLTRISGIGPKLATMLNESGIWHFAQIATWTDDELAWVDGHIGAFRGRARRDDWIGQARALVAGGDASVAGAPEPDAGRSEPS